MPLPTEVLDVGGGFRSFGVRGPVIFTVLN